jgi:hypothetical protein
MYAEMVRDMLAWHRQHPDNWQKTWELVDKKYRKDKNYYISQLDVKLEGAFVLMGLLYGQNDPDKTIIISCRCGSDSDCNPSSAAGVLFTSMGMSKLPDRFYRKLDQTKVFSHTAYTFPALIQVCEKLARQSLLKEGGRIEKDADGEESFVIPVKSPRPSVFEDLKQPGPIAGARFTEQEMRAIENPGFNWALSNVLKGWQADKLDARRSSFAWERNGRKAVFTLVGDKDDNPIVLTRTLELPAGKKSALQLAASCDPKGAGWDLVVKVNGKEIISKPIKDRWPEVTVDLTEFAGTTATVAVAGTPKVKNPKGGSVYYLSGLSLKSQ